MKVRDSAHIEETYLFKSLGKEANGDSEFEVKLVAVNNSAVVNGIREGVNTNDIKKTGFSSSSVILTMALLYQPLYITINPKGELIKLTGFKELVKKAAVKWQLDEELTTMIAEDEPFINTTLQWFFLNLPDKRINYNAEWKWWNSTFKVTGIKGALLEITAKPDSAINTISGTYLFNDVTGLIEKANTRTLFKADNGSQWVEDYAQEVNYNATPVVTDTAWINMAVKMSSWSDALRVNNKPKQKELLAYFKENDKPFRNDAHYRSRKLSMIQDLDDKNKSNTYDSLLFSTPNALLTAMPHHTSNKLLKIMDNPAGSLDSALAVTRFFYTSDQFNDWVQHSFSQDFKPWDEAGNRDFLRKRDSSEAAIDKAMIEIKTNHKRSRQLLQMYQAAKEPLLIRKKTEALYLWVLAQEQKGKPQSLINIANKLGKMTEKDMLLNNGGRYNLLVYNLLVDAKRIKEANSLLQITLQKLEANTADELNGNRYADQNLLAYAYYLQYLAAKPADSVKALKYLAKAAAYSPKTKNQEDVTSFYDRSFFLNAKESYRDDFIQKLFAIGDKEQALAIIAEHLNANPQNIADVQELFTKYVPERSFKDFFAKGVVGIWEPAPNFKLKDIDGKERALSDYKDKWLVLDFWGTWCGPCRAEMPRVNEFNNQVVGGELAGVNFMSISCYDTEEKIKSFLTENKYSIPVLVSDNVVQRNYKITGYPSKILISPDGGMLPVKHGTDWRAVIKTFSQLYAAN
ncbi:hypothetical protein GCM10023149_48090 [Mucilaginibacter gynuensis]|uniref:Thioredoxin domain-containing protein n=1 Tax=Mucilaginibacter gynuensis TaxID=1302236 RepID=A0ABP8HEF7_9SPHI